MDIDATAHVFVSDLEDLTLDDDDRHHLGRVLRPRPDVASAVAGD